jgi:hypothetical protein
MNETGGWGKGKKVKKLNCTRSIYCERSFGSKTQQNEGTGVMSFADARAEKSGEKLWVALVAGKYKQKIPRKYNNAVVMKNSVKSERRSKSERHTFSSSRKIVCDTKNFFCRKRRVETSCRRTHERENLDPCRFTIDR